MVCENCNDEGRKAGTERKNKITYTVYTLCLCEIGKKLEKLWEQYPAWVGAPYSFFMLGEKSCVSRAGAAGPSTQQGCHKPISTYPAAKVEVNK